MESSNKLSLKLLIDTKSRKVLFAEAGKEFVDFLLNLLALPVGTVIKLLSKKSMVGSIGNLYHSIENLSETYIQPNINKQSILNPKTLTSSINNNFPLLLGPSDDLLSSMKFYLCPQHSEHVSDDPRATCPACYTSIMTREVKYFPFNGSLGKGKSSACDGSEGGFVKGVVTYMVMDDLVVSPMSTMQFLASLCSTSFMLKRSDLLKRRLSHSE